MQLSISGCTDDILDSLGLPEDVKIEKDGETIRLSVADKKAMEQLKPAVIQALSRFIIDKYEKGCLGKIINQNYCYYSPFERSAILKTFEHDGAGEMPERVNIIREQLSEYLNTKDEIQLDGFVNFRLKEYKKRLEALVDKAVESFLTKREYQEFIKLLKFFVSLQQNREPHVHVVAEMGGYYTIYNQMLMEITFRCALDFGLDIGGEKINYDDLLISSLITLAPHKITLHNSDRIKKIEVLETINKVFPGAVALCPGCSLCDGS